MPPRDSNPNSVYSKAEEEKEREELEKISNEKMFYKLADYFVTVGIDNYHTEDEIYRKKEESKG